MLLMMLLSSAIVRFVDGGSDVVPLLLMLLLLLHLLMLLLLTSLPRWSPLPLFDVVVLVVCIVLQFIWPLVCEAHCTWHKSVRRKFYDEISFIWTVLCV